MLNFIIMISWSLITLINIHSIYQAIMEHTFAGFALGMVGTLCGAYLVNNSIQTIVKGVKK